MSIEIKILGQPTRDNAAYLTIDSGQQITRLLFDCGHGCLDELPISELHSLDALFISHFHMDHVSDFDSLLRFNFSREDSSPFLVIGPEDTCRVIHHKLQGFTWNLVADSLGVVQVHEYAAGKQRRLEFHTKEKFVSPSQDKTVDWNDRVVFENNQITVSMIELDHGCTSAGYLVREKSKSNIDSAKMKELGLSPGPWLKSFKDGDSDSPTISIDGKQFERSKLRDELIVQSKGQSFAYITDFRVEGPAWDELVEFIRGVDILLCENSYASADKDLAEKNYHMTTSDVSQLADQAGVGELILFHLSSRYAEDTFPAQLDEARSVFANTRWPEGWFE